MGFKFSSAIGHILSSLITEETDPEMRNVLRHFALDRAALKDATFNE